jgi:hypothetical protein
VYLRFDVFDDEPHYHYVHRTDDGSVVNQVIDFDTAAHGDMLPWVIECLRSRLSDMLRAAGGDRIGAQVDQNAISGVIDEVMERAQRARQTHTHRRRNTKDKEQ